MDILLRVYSFIHMGLRVLSKFFILWFFVYLNHHSTTCFSNTEFNGILYINHMFRRLFELGRSCKRIFLSENVSRMWILCGKDILNSDLFTYSSFWDRWFYFRCLLIWFLHFVYQIIYFSRFYFNTIRSQKFDLRTVLFLNMRSTGGNRSTSKHWKLRTWISFWFGSSSINWLNFICIWLFLIKYQFRILG